MRERVERGARVVAAIGALAAGACGERADAPTAVVQREPPLAEPVDPRLSCVDDVAAPPELLAVVRALCADLENLGVVGAAIAIADGGKIVLATGVGRRCIGGAERPEADTPFRFGSITKLFTSVLALSLVDAGKLDLDAPVVRYLPDLRLRGEGAPKLSLRHLLTHTAGVRDMMPTAALAESGADAWLDELQSHPLLLPPGALFNYSNAGYYIAGRALERVGGASFPTLLRRHVLEPRALKRTTADADRAVRMGAACGHTRGDAGLVARDVARDFEQLAHGAAWAAPAGAVVGSAADLVRFVLGLHRDHTLDDLVSTAVPTHVGADAWYGLGLGWEPLPDGTRLFHHSGNTGDFAADVYWIPERGFAVAVLAGGGRHLRATLRAVRQQVAGLEPKSPVPAAELQAYVGAYETTVGGVSVRVERRGDALALLAPELGYDGAQLSHVDRHTFAVPAVSGRGTVRLSFVMSDDRSRVRLLRAPDFVAVPQRGR